MRRFLEMEDETREVQTLVNSCEKKLLFAVIERAINDYTFPVYSRGKISSEDRHASRAAEAWIYEKQGTYLRGWSFMWICEQLEEGTSVTGVAKTIRSYLRDQLEDDIEFQLAA